ncbi:MAG: ABC transporter ATP-binding protein [Rhodospirillales bacterium]|mgnify:CR=1 FL=1|jgi:ABC-type branched-subunit amino acid transport system ATPase component|nr:ABC transporter ATP-binding protein [Rhodospirillales bacterium]MDP6646752.1 ABC transporter ATP-binding protein [Rhodospirillales bacterium]MDP6843512.1 ABC transporter ATP-binding protein [Rhodospirillales bacterium]
MSEAILETHGLSKNFGALSVARDIDFALVPGARHAIIGPNGAGKTTFINLLTGALRPSAGAVHLGGHDITAMAQHQRVKHGIARTFQINTLFMGLSVIENLYLAVSEHMGVATGILRPAGRNAAVIEEAVRLLGVLELEDDALTEIHELPYGRQRLVEIAIALALDPKVLLLDEPAAGVPNAESHIILDAVDGLPKDIAVLIIEHDMDVVFRFAERITVLVRGAILADGPPGEIAANEEVQAVYLGEASHV